MKDTTFCSIIYVLRYTASEAHERAMHIQRIEIFKNKPRFEIKVWLKCVVEQEF